MIKGLNIENMKQLNELQKYVGKEVYIILNGCGADEYWGTIDSEPPSLIERTIESFTIFNNSIRIDTGYMESFDINKFLIYFNSEEAISDFKAYRQKSH